MIYIPNTHRSLMCSLINFSCVFFQDASDFFHIIQQSGKSPLSPNGPFFFISLKFCKNTGVVKEYRGLCCIFMIFLLFNEFYYIYSCTVIITIQFYSISIPNPQHIPTPPNLSHLETKSFSLNMSQYLFCKEVHCILFLDSICQW